MVHVCEFVCGCDKLMVCVCMYVVCLSLCLERRERGGRKGEKVSKCIGESLKEKEKKRGGGGGGESERRKRRETSVTGS